MKRRLFRWENCLLPAACLIGALLGHAALSIRFFAAHSVLSLASMCADGAFCIDAARQTTFRQVDRRFLGSNVQIMIGGIAAALLINWLFPMIVNIENAHLLVAAGMACAGQMYVEWFHAHHMRKDACLTAFLQALLAVAGFGLDSVFSVSGRAIDFAMMISAVIATVSLYIVPWESVSAVPRCYARAPRALWQNLLYPAAVFGAAFAHGEMPPAIPVLAGWMVWRGARTVCRRSESESVPLRFWVTAICGAANIAALFIPPLRCLSSYLTLAMLCIVIVFVHFSLRTALAAILLIAVQALMILNPLPQIHLYIIASLFSILSVVCSVDRYLLPRKRRAFDPSSCRAAGSARFQQLPRI